MDNVLFAQLIEHIIYSIIQSGCDPYLQLVAYLKTNNASYITRRGDACKLIQQLEKDAIHRFIQSRFGP